MRSYDWSIITYSNLFDQSQLITTASAVFAILQITILPIIAIIMEEEKVAASAFRAVYDNVKGTAKEQRQQRQDAWNEFETDLKVSKRSKKRKRKQESIVLPADLETACKEGNLPFVKARLDSKSNSILIEAKTMDGHTALHLASLFNHLEILRCILSSSAWLYSTKKIDMTSNTGSTALVRII